MCMILKEATALERGFELARTHCQWIRRGLCAAFFDNRGKQVRNQLSLLSKTWILKPWGLWLLILYLDVQRSESPTPWGLSSFIHVVKDPRAEERRQSPGLTHATSPNTWASCLSWARCQDSRPDVITWLEQGWLSWMVWGTSIGDSLQVGRSPGSSHTRLSSKPVASRHVATEPSPRGSRGCFRNTELAQSCLWVPLSSMKLLMLFSLVLQCTSYAP